MATLAAPHPFFFCWKKGTSRATCDLRSGFLGARLQLGSFLGGQRLRRPWQGLRFRRGLELHLQLRLLHRRSRQADGQRDCQDSRK
jgi:hypothetical protein